MRVCVFVGIFWGLFFYYSLAGGDSEMRPVRWGSFLMAFLEDF